MERSEMLRELKEANQMLDNVMPDSDYEYVEKVIEQAIEYVENT